MIAPHNALDRLELRRRLRLVLMLVMCIICMFFIALPESRAAGDAVATGTRVGGDATRTRFVADVSKTVSYSVYVLPDPYRVIIDMPDVKVHICSGNSQ